ncbi:uncharacterized protein VTP21DRAFT_4149 [Calcarisporiella thermophila]|uniref:uncharacterized protein n=1 Tax=Calcarisporiella thermophila TaxID=911321 RepID=UPI003742C2AB
MASPRKRDYSSSPPRRRSLSRRERSRSPEYRSRGRSSRRSYSPSSSHRKRSYSRSRSRSNSGSRSHPHSHSRDRNRDRDRGERLRDSNESKPRKEEEQPKEKPNFGLSGKLAAETKTVNGVELKYHEPPEARKPDSKWRLYVFKDKEMLDTLHIYRQSAFLIGRERLVVDIPVDHPSCSKQHAVLQFKQIQVFDEKEFQHKRIVKPFIIDLESTNGTYVNGERIPGSRYYELKMKDVLKFGFSTREYVLLHE